MSKDKKKKDIPPLLGVKEEVQSFFDLQKDSKNLTIERKVEKVFFMRVPYEGYELSCVHDTETISVNVRSATNPTVFPRKLKIAPTALPTMTGNASKVFPASLLSIFANLPNHFFNAPSSFGGEPPVPLPPPKTPVIAKAIVEIVIERAVSIENMVMPCFHKLRYEFFLPRTYFDQELFQGFA